MMHPRMGPTKVDDPFDNVDSFANSGGQRVSGAMRSVALPSKMDTGELVRGVRKTAVSVNVAGRFIRGRLVARVVRDDMGS